MVEEDKPLFGGAVRCFIPARFDDVSKVREVPDNQEVFADASTEQSIIIELLESDPQIANSELVKYHFTELASTNNSAQNQIVHIETLDQSNLPHFGQDVIKYSLYGTQQVSKYKEQALNTVNVYMCVIRIPQVTTDILITLNDGVVVNPDSSSVQFIVPDTKPNAEQTMALFKEILRSFRILDYGLFV